MLFHTLLMTLSQHLPAVTATQRFCHWIELDLRDNDFHIKNLGDPFFVH